MSNNKITNFDKFICTVIKPLYFLALITSITIMLISINKFSKYFNILWITSLLIFAILMLTVYNVSKKIKNKKNTLIIKKITLGKKLLFIITSVITMLVTTLLLAVWTVHNLIN